MNNRIRELAEQAGYKDLPTVRLAFDGFDKEKFAELIVRECADQCTTDGPFCAEVVWGKQFNKKILEHFGVDCALDSKH